MAAGVIRGGPMVAGVEVSVVTSEQHTMTAKATQQAIESGAVVTDHVILDPLQLSVSCEIGNVGGSSAARGVFEAFSAAMQKREPLEVITEHAVYKDMLILSLTPLHAAPFKGALQITAQMQQLKRVEFRVSGRTAVKLSTSRSADKTASAEVNRGKQELKSTLLGNMASGAADLLESLGNR